MSDTLTINEGEFDRVMQHGPDALYLFIAQFTSTQRRDRGDAFPIKPFWRDKHVRISRQDWTIARLKKALAPLLTDGVLIDQGDGMYSWGPTAEDMDEFCNMVGAGMKPSVARKKLVASGVPDPGAAFWTAQAKELMDGFRDLTALNSECTGPGGEIYGHR